MEFGMLSIKTRLSSKTGTEKYFLCRDKYKFMETGYITLTVVAIMLTASIWLFHKGLERKIHAYYKRSARKVYKIINGQEQVNATVIPYLRKISPYVFEELVLLAYEKKGYKVKRNRRYSGNGGIDGHVMMNKVWIPIQAKRYKSHIKRKHVLDFENLIVRRNKPYGLFIHTGRTGKGSRGNEFPHVQIVSGERLLDLIMGQKRVSDNTRENTRY